MKDKTISISKTASKFGFSSNASFTKAFKKYYGINPTNSFRLNASEIIFQWL
jgi:AraC-like DNA-binding protein